MIDLFPFIVEKLKHLATIDEESPDIDTVMPYIAFSTIDDTSDIVIDGVERLNGKIIQLECFHNSRVEAQVLSESVNAVLLSCGFKRTGGPDRKYGDIYSKIMRFTGRIDEKTKIIHT